MKNIVNIQIHGQARNYLAETGDLELVQGDKIIVEDSHGLAFARVLDPPYKMPDEFAQQETIKILRQASKEDSAHFESNCQLEKEAVAIARERIQKHELEMNLVSSYYPFDNNKLLFYFTADGRVDFRELVRDLASIFHTRIELRQIGVRDEAGMIGGLGVCGRELCCASFLKCFQPVSIRMAKDQNLSMNPTKISGACGRLLCCLNYEQEAYVSAAERLPGRNAKVRYQGETGIVESVDLLREKLRVKFDREDEAEIKELALEEVEILFDPNNKKGEAKADTKGESKNKKPEIDKKASEDAKERKNLPIKKVRKNPKGRLKSRQKKNKSEADKQ